MHGNHPRLISDGPHLEVLPKKKWKRERYTHLVGNNTCMSENINNTHLRPAAASRP